ncbi:hypothetical protein D3C87_1187920 [compost metagenome]
MDDARVEVHVRVQLALHEVRIRQGDAFQFHGQLEQRVVFQAQGRENFLAGFLHQLGARIVVLVDAVAKAHQAHARVLVLDLLHELADLGDAAVGLQFFQHLQAGFVGAAVSRAPQASHAGRDGGERVGARRTAQTHGRGRGVLFVIGVQDEDAVQRALDDFIDLVVFARRGEHHAQEVARVGQVILRVDERLALRVLVCHRDQRRHLGDQADRRDVAMLRVRDVGGVVVERGQRADQARQHGHRVRVAAEAAQEEMQLLVDHRVMGHLRVEIGLLVLVGQFAVQDQVADVHEVAIDGQLLDREAAVQQFALVAIDVRDARFAGSRRHEARVKREHARLAIKLADVDHIRTDRALVDRELNGCAAIREG